jgi:hypothetical protein
MHRAILTSLLLAASGTAIVSGAATCDIKDYGASGRKSELATGAIARAIDDCAAKGGGTVVVPPGEYTSGTIRLKSHITLRLEPGATIFASLEDKDFEPGLRTALIFGENLENIGIEGRGTLDGQASYDWRLMDFDDAFIRENMLLWKSMGKPLLRSFPKRIAEKGALYPKLVLLLRCKDVRITGVSMLHSRSWTLNPYGCERVVIDGIHIVSSLKDAVWADGIDPDGCKDVRISNSTVETGDDALVFYSMDWFGPALPCENITVTNCRLSSASSAIKFCDGIKNSVRRVTINNVVITDSNRGIAFMNFDGGTVSDVVMSNITIDTTRHDWFWWGDGDPIHFNIKRRSQIDGRTYENEPAAGKIRNVILRDIVAHGQGMSQIHGHPDSWLENVTIENLKLFLTNAPDNAMEKATSALHVRWARNLRMRDVEVHWGEPASKKWGTAIDAEDVTDSVWENLAVRPAKDAATSPAIRLAKAERITLRNPRLLPGVPILIDIEKAQTKDIEVIGAPEKLVRRR